MKRLTAIACLILTAGFVSSPVTMPGRACESAELKGAWALELTPDKGAPSSAYGKTLHGDLAFLSSGWAVRASLVPSVQPDALYGVFDLDFEPLGPSFRLRSALPITKGRTMGDSLEAELLPQVDHGGFVLQGHCVGGGFSGRWYQKVPGGLQGLFAMRRIN